MMELVSSNKWLTDSSKTIFELRPEDIDGNFLKAKSNRKQKFESSKFLHVQLCRSLKDWEVSSLQSEFPNELFINCLTIKSTWDDLILYHKGPSDVKESRVMDLKLCYITFKFKKGTQKLSGAKETDQTECHKCGMKGYFARDCFSKTSVPSYQSHFQPKLLHSSKHKPELWHTKDFEAKYNKVKAKLTLLNSSASAPNSSSGKNKGLIAETYEWDEEEVSSDDNKATEVKALVALANEERVFVGKESASNEQRNNLLSKHRNLVHELNTCKEQLLVLKQAKLNLLTIQHVNTEILKENQILGNELKKLTSITETWLNSSNKVNQCISEQIPTQKEKILGIDQLTKDTSSSGPKDLVFVKSSTEDFTLPNHDTGKVFPYESQRNTIDPSVAVTDSSATSYDSADESLVYSTPLPPLEKQACAKLVFGPKTIKSILKSNSTFKAETLKGVPLKEPSSSLVKDNRKVTSASKTYSASAGKLKNVKIEDDPSLATVMKELNELKLQLSKNKSSYSKNHQSQ
ncbi:retrovirus-related pol polyprotein from transposon TNT 1-94 [Tanacetum coccineum]